MSCSFPIKAIQYKNLPGKNPNTHPIRILRKEEYDKVWNDDVEVLELPCGQCTGCRFDYARQWANRLMLELEHYKENKWETKFYVKDGITYSKDFLYDIGSCYFITLTIDNDNIESTGFEKQRRGDIPKLHCRRPVYNADDGLVTMWSHSICKHDLQLFLKRLRKQHPNDEIRFFACGEYGSDSARPHYHLIVFGLHLDDDDLTFYKKSKLGYDYNNSKSIAKIWPYGYNVVAPVTWESCCYVARYMMKKIKGTGAKIYDDFNIEEPFVVMSRRPGISHWYYENHPMDSVSLNVVIGTESGSRKFPHPRYLEKLFELDDPESAKVRKQSRRLSAINSKNLVLKQQDKPADKYLADQEEKFLKNCKTLDYFRRMQ